MAFPTRLLVLGAVRILQPVHGYDVRRELQSWRLEEWTNAQPGSVYSALKTLERDRLIVEADRTAIAGRPDKTRYVLTGEGEKEFEVMLRAAWWNVETSTEPLVPALSLMVFLSREEMIAALTARLGQLDAKLGQLRFLRSSIRDGATGEGGEIPEHVREVVDFFSARTKAEREWTRALSKRLREGAYKFADEWEVRNSVDI
jgi:DNA-binding PadR family transcriptional regulator